MGESDPRVDAYIERSRDFAKPIMTYLRAMIHESCPDVKENIKWSMPSFEYKGILCGFAAFKEHCSFGFKSLMEQSNFPEQNAMGSFGRIRSLKDLPNKKTLKKIIAEAVKLNELGIKAEKKMAPKKEVAVPDILLEALAQNEKAAATFENFPPSCKREYIEWIFEAKTDATRNKRLATTIEWLNEGKRRNWKYAKC